MGKKQKRKKNKLQKQDSSVPSAQVLTDASAAGEKPQPVLHAIRDRRSFSKVTDTAPTRAELEQLIQVLSSVPDHSNMMPWRIIELRDESRNILGRSLAEAELEGKSSADSPDYAEKLEKAQERYIAKAQRAPLVLAVVACTTPSTKVPEWEQEAVASGVAHSLSLLLHEAGWGTIWRTGALTRSDPVRRAHQLHTGELLLGWIYVGGIPEKDAKAKPRKPLDLERHLSSL